jgi:hypothetical protein
MQEAGETFGYSAQRSSYVNMIGVFVFLLIVEGGATELLITLFVPILWLKLTIEVVTVVLSVYTIVVLLCPLWTKHRLTSTHLSVRYSFMLHVDVPLAAISNMQAVRKTPSTIQAVSARYEAKQQRIVACFSQQGMVLLTLHRPIAVKLGLKTRTTTNILLNVDRRDEFLVALAATQGALLEVPMTEQVGTVN